MEKTTNRHFLDSFEKILFFSFMLIQYNFFLIRYTGFSAGITPQLLLLTIPSLLIVFTRGVNKKEYNYSQTILVLLIMLFISTIWSGIQYPDQLRNILINTIPWISILSYFSLSSFARCNRSFFLKTITIMNIVCCVVFLLQLFYYYSGTLFLDEKFFQNEFGVLHISIRGNNIRILNNWQIMIASMLISISEILKTKKIRSNKINLINCSVTTLCLFWIIQTRALIAILLISLALSIGVFFFKKNKIYTFLFFIATIFSFFILYSFFGISNFIDSFFDTFNDSRYAISTTARLDALPYFFKIIKSSPFLGNGVYTGFVGSESYLKALGPLGIYYYSDVGIIGNLAQYGVLSLLVFFTYLRSSLKIVFLNRKKHLWIFVFYFSFTMLTTLSWIYKLSIIPFILTLSYIDSEGD